MKTLLTGLLALALFATAWTEAQALPGDSKQGVTAHYSQSGEGIHKRRYYYGYRPNYRPYYRPYYGYRPNTYRYQVNRPYFYYGGPGFYFETGRPYVYPRNYYYYW